MKKLVFLYLLIMHATLLFADPVSFVKFTFKDSESWGILREHRIIEIDAAPWINQRETGRYYSLEEVDLLPPVSPTKVLAIGLNYRSHSGDAGAAKPELFAKFPSSVQGGGNILIPEDAVNIHYEGELVIVIGRETKDVDVREARESIFGITIGNDISERSWQSSDLQWTRAKASDGFAPVGPKLVQGQEWSDLLISTFVNGELRQNESTAKLIHSPEEIVSWVSRYITLEPGDIIFTGTPGRTQRVSEGDLIEVKIENIGILSNRVVWE
ncbi:MAG: fumarylacetoacetate hydrolase family protein [Spirochaetales bacterium]|uniref:Fumarylacetoacetate hydrolase family protein n=1 Tax=Candidatus Thalassospirochaeta sargassi TaxID=3119039 RepID=A0AAJ1MNX2_9SPIO|nr:fumarylacetoacetate hydrolase family protein [Spirochaetales bacterium]